MIEEEKSQGNNRQNQQIGIGTVIEALPSTIFRVKFEDGAENLAYLSGKMRLHRIRVLVGDKVEVLLDSYGGKGRIQKRL